MLHTHQLPVRVNIFLFFRSQKTIEILSKEEGYTVPDGPRDLSNDDKLKVQAFFAADNVMPPTRVVPYQM